MAGTLTIHTSGSGALMSGHCWIEYKLDAGGSRTYGVWGNSPTGVGNGLFENLEAGRKGRASRSAHLSDEQAVKLLKVIQEYKDKGALAWEAISGSAAFAAEAWAAATGELIAHRSGAISNATKLGASLGAANANETLLAGQRDAKPNPARPDSSRRICQSAVEVYSSGN